MKLESLLKERADEIQGIDQRLNVQYKDYNGTKISDGPTDWQRQFTKSFQGGHLNELKQMTDQRYSNLLSEENQLGRY